MLRITPEQITRNAAAEVLHSYGEPGFNPGSFSAALIVAIKAADPTNTGKLATVFPEYVNAVRMVEGDRMEELRAIAGQA